MARPLALLVLVSLAAVAMATPVRVTTVTGVPRSGTLVGLTGEEVRFETSTGDVQTHKLREIVGLEFERPDDPKRLRRPDPDGEQAEREVTVHLAGGDRLLGILADGDEDGVKLASPVLGDLDIPLDAVRDIRFAKAGERGVLSRRVGEKDSLTYRRGDTLTGWIGRFDEDALRIDCVFREDYRVPYTSIAAVHLSPEPLTPGKGLRVQLTMVDGGRLTGRSPQLTGGRLRLSPVLAGSPSGETAWSVPLGLVRHLTVLGGAFVHLSDLEDTEVEVVPFFPTSDPMLDPKIWLAPRRDRSFLGRPLTLGGRVYHKGMGVVSGTLIRVKLDGTYRRFRATVGVDDHAGPRGSVTFEVLLDGKIRYRSNLLRTGTAPIALPAVDLGDARRLELKVGYGDEAGADVQDIANWCEPVLVK